MWIRMSIALLSLPKIPWKSDVSKIFSQKLNFCLFFVYIVNDCEYLQTFVGALTCDIMVTSYEDGWYFLVSEERRDP